MAVATAPRQAVILAAGLGSRLRPMTNRCAKPMVEVHGVPILHNALHHLAAVGVTHATIVVGYRKESIKASCGTDFSGLKISYTESSVFDRTGSAYSLWLARDALLRGDTFLIEGEVFFERAALARLISKEGEDAAAVAPFDETMEGSAVLLSDDGNIVEVRTKQTADDLRRNTGPTLFKTMNLLRFAAGSLRNSVVPALDDLVERGETKVYTEQLLGQLIRERGFRLGAARCDDLRWYEIDSLDDLRTAERIFAPAAAAHAAAL
jgi:NDP-sugar pyrophosphorylase family protein